MKLRVGIVGLGDAWENRHKPALRALSDRFEVRAICAEVARKAEQAAEAFRAEPMESFRLLARRPDIDAVLIFSADWYGPLPILAACEAGKAVYTATALDIDPQQARAVKERVETSGVAFMAEFPRRHAPATLRLKELIATRLGAPRLLFCHQRYVEQRNARPPRGRCPLLTRDLMEYVDWCCYVAGQNPTSVLGVRHRASRPGDEDDYRMMSLDFSPPGGEVGTGVIAQISRSRYISQAWTDANTFGRPPSLQAACERGVAFIDLPATLVWFDEAGQHVESLERERPVGEQLLMQFHRAAFSLVRKKSDLEDAWRALTVVLAAHESVERGQRQPIET